MSLHDLVASYFSNFLSCYITPLFIYSASGYFAFFAVIFFFFLSCICWYSFLDSPTEVSLKIHVWEHSSCIFTLGVDLLNLEECLKLNDRAWYNTSTKANATNVSSRRQQCQVYKADVRKAFKNFACSF